MDTKEITTVQQSIPISSIPVGSVDARYDERRKVLYRRK